MWAIFDPMGWMSHGETCPLGARIHLSLYYGSTSPLCLASSWIHYKIYLLVLLSQNITHPTPRSIPLPGPFARTVGGGSVVTHSHLGVPVLLLFVSPFSILGLTLNSFKERSTDKCYVFTNPIIWNLSPPVQVHHSAQEMGGV